MEKEEVIDGALLAVEGMVFGSQVIITVIGACFGFGGLFLGATGKLIDRQRLGKGEEIILFTSDDLNAIINPVAFSIRAALALLSRTNGRREAPKKTGSLLASETIWSEELGAENVRVANAEADGDMSGNTEQRTQPRDNCC